LLAELEKDADENGKPAQRELLEAGAMMNTYASRR
jgi:hypothetical protein